MEKAFWDGGDARAFSISFSIFKERRVRIDYCKICRGGGGEFRDEKLGVRLETIKMDEKEEMIFGSTILKQKGNAL